MRDKLIIVISGPIGSGKTTLAENLTQFGFKVLKTKEALKTRLQSGQYRLKGKSERDKLQELGARLDKKTKGAWLIEHFQQEIMSNSQVIIDSCRIKLQIDQIRDAYGSQSVVHIHLTASDEELEARFINRNETGSGDKVKLKAAYRSAKVDSTESHVEDLSKYADLVMQTDRNSPEEVCVRAASLLGLYGRGDKKLVDVIVGGQFGSEGKGQIAAHLAPEYDCLIRVGGPNAGHKVFEQSDPDIFRSIPSGTRRAPKAKILIGPGAIIDLDLLIQEIKEYRLTTDRLAIDENVTIISSRDKALERKLDKISSTQKGVGAATACNILNRLKHEDKYKAKNYRELKGFVDTNKYRHTLDEMFQSGKRILLEGTQGTLLSLHHGMFPHVTSRDTTVSGCLAESGIPPTRVRKVVMVTRTYPIRVGGPSGPFIKGTASEFSEIDMKTIARRSGLDEKQLKKHEKATVSGKPRRIAEFSWTNFRLACELNAPTDIALTFVDYLSKTNREAYRYEQLHPETIRFIEELEKFSSTPVSLISTNFDSRPIIDRRNW